MVARMVTGAALTALMAMASSASAQSAPATYLTLQPESRLWVEGTSTVRSFSCKATKIDGTVEAASNSAVAAVVAGEKAVRSLRVVVPARSLDCDNATMNEHMHKALNVQAHPTIVFTLTSYELAPRGDAARVTLVGKLQLGGQEKPITMTADVVQGPGGALRAVGTQPVRLTDHGLKPPTLMMGTMKVGDVVQVKYDVLLKQ